MKRKFAKIIELESNQVVLIKGFDNEESKFTVAITTHLDGVTATATLGFKTEEQADQYWSEFDYAQANAFVSQMEEAFN